MRHLLTLNRHTAKEQMTMRQRMVTRISMVGIVFCASCTSFQAGMEAARRDREARTDRAALVAQTIPTCVQDAECSRKWSAAQAWVSQNSGYKIQTATDTIIDTYNPTSKTWGIGETGDIGVRVIKEPTGSAGYRFLITVLCSSPYGCQPDEVDAALDFNQYVNRISAPTTP